MPQTVTSCAVRSYHTFSPLPQLVKPNYGGLFSAALSVGLRPPDVIWRSTLWSPDFPLSNTLFMVKPRTKSHQAIAEPAPAMKITLKTN